MVVPDGRDVGPLLEPAMNVAVGVHVVRQCDVHAIMKRNRRRTDVMFRKQRLDAW
jgi:hypothetical protein